MNTISLLKLLCYLLHCRKVPKKRNNIKWIKTNFLQSSFWWSITKNVTKFTWKLVICNQHYYKPSYSLVDIWYHLLSACAVKFNQLTLKRQLINALKFKLFKFVSCMNNMRWIIISFPVNWLAIVRRNNTKII